MLSRWLHPVQVAASRRRDLFRPQLFCLEERLPPGDALLGTLLAPALLGHAKPVAVAQSAVSAGATPGPRAPVGPAVAALRTTAAAGSSPRQGRTGHTVSAAALAAGTRIRTTDFGGESRLDLLAGVGDALDPAALHEPPTDAAPPGHPRAVADQDAGGAAGAAPFAEGQALVRAPSLPVGDASATPAGVGIGRPAATAGDNWANVVLALLDRHASGASGQPAGGLTPGHQPPPPGGGTCSVTLTPDEPAPQLVGDAFTWTATLDGDCGDSPVFQFNAGPTGKALAMIQDFSPRDTFPWAAMQEGDYAIQVTVEDGYGGNVVASALVSDRVDPRATGTDPVVTALANPLVALYSAPPCTGNTMQVYFRAVDDPLDVPWRQTNAVPCAPDLTENFLVAGMRPETTYKLVGVTDKQTAPPVFFTTGSLPTELVFPQFTLVQPPGPFSDLSQDMALHLGAGRDPADLHVNLLATDLAGNPLWYYDPRGSGVFVWSVSLVSGGTALLLSRDQYRATGYNVLREIDLAGNRVRETNVDAVNAQLEAMGLPVIYSFHHDAQRLPDGGTAVLAYSQKTLDVNGVPTDFMGSTLLVLDGNFQVVWTWDGFDYLDPRQLPYAGRMCRDSYGDAFCPVPDPAAIDYLHANAVAWSPGDGNLLVSSYTQSRVFKIDYQGGAGDGHIIWTLGDGGDFAIHGDDPYPWFSNQHNAHYIDDHTLVVYDNGVTRCNLGYNCDSRGQVLVLDENAMEATLVVNADLGGASYALGSGQLLSNGNYVFESGFLFSGTTPYSQTIEVLPDGTSTYVLQRGDVEYRAARLSGLYDGIPG